MNRLHGGSQDRQPIPWVSGAPFVRRPAEGSGMSDKSADGDADRNESGVGDRRVWTTPTVTEHRGLAVEGGVESDNFEDPFYHS